MTATWITAQQLHDRVQKPEGIVILDVRHWVGQSSQEERYRAGHLPGAIFVDLRRDLADSTVHGRGRNPLPDIAALQESVRSWGISDSTEVVVYADQGAPSAGRAWWTLTWAGLTSVMILDGGIDAWVDAGFDLETVEPAPSPGTATLTPGHLPDVPVDEVSAYAATGQLVDARDAAAYQGSSHDADSGHIPLSVSLPYDRLLAGDGRVDLDAAARIIEDAGIDKSQPVALTCGGGVAAALSAAIYTELGYDARLHVGSWSEWISDPTRPRTIGAAP